MPFRQSRARPPEPVVTIVFNESGRDAFFEVTGRVARNRDVLAIYLDNVELVAPTVNTQGGQGIADGRAIISGGDFTTERVRTLAIQLRSRCFAGGVGVVRGTQRRRDPRCRFFAA